MFIFQQINNQNPSNINCRMPKLYFFILAIFGTGIFSGQLSQAAPSGPVATGVLAEIAQKKTIIPQTGQEESFFPGDDGDLQKGVHWPVPRFKDNGNGTVMDNLTGLIWLKDAGCLGEGEGKTWLEALERVASLNNGEDLKCKDYESGTFQNWRLPNLNEMRSLIDIRVDSPALPNTLGDGKCEPNNPFWTQSHDYDTPIYPNPLCVKRAFYWSSTTTAWGAAWVVDLLDGDVQGLQKDEKSFVWAVRSK